MTRRPSDEFDVIVIGGGVVGSAIAWGLAKIGQKVAVLDEGDNAFRASRGNFALIWVQGKGLGMPGYVAWTIKSIEAWAGFADQLRQQTGFDLHLQQNGGFHLALSETELEQRDRLLNQLHNQPAMQHYDYEILNHDRVKIMLPAIGTQVVGGCYCPLDGHVNSLKLFRALHGGMQMLGAVYKPNHAVESIDYRQGEFCLLAASAELRASKVVLAAGLGNARLAPMAGLSAPVRPQRGQLIVTEKTAPFMPYPVATVRQTDEGGVMVGDSQEEAGFNSALRCEILSVMAERAVCMFPHLGRLNVVRSWAALRIMTKDGFPIYDHSMQFPGAFIATCHSGITLAANHALILAPSIARGDLPVDEFGLFSARRFNVSAVA